MDLKDLKGKLDTTDIKINQEANKKYEFKDLVADVKKALKEDNMLVRAKLKTHEMEARLIIYQGVRSNVFGRLTPKDYIFYRATVQKRLQKLLDKYYQ